MTTLTNPKRAVLVALDQRNPDGAQASLLLSLPDVDIDVMSDLFEADLIEGRRAGQHPRELISDRDWKRGRDVADRRDALHVKYFITPKGETVIRDDQMVKLLSLLCSAPRHRYPLARCLQVADVDVIDRAQEQLLVKAFRPEDGLESNELASRYVRTPDLLVIELRKKAERILGTGMTS